MPNTNPRSEQNVNKEWSYTSTYASLLVAYSVNPLLLSTDKQGYNKVSVQLINTVQKHAKIF
jgi:hypothetical protein